MDEPEIQRHNVDSFLDSIDVVSPKLEEFSLTPRWKFYEMSENQNIKFDMETPRDKYPINTPLRPKKSKRNYASHLNKSKKNLKFSSDSFLTQFPKIADLRRSHSDGTGNVIRNGNSNNIEENKNDNFKNACKRNNCDLFSRRCRREAVASADENKCDVDIIISSPPSSPFSSSSSVSSILSGFSPLNSASFEGESNSKDVGTACVRSQKMEDADIQNNSPIFTSTPLERYMNFDFEEMSSISDCKSDCSIPLMPSRKLSTVCSSDYDFSIDHDTNQREKLEDNSSDFSGSDKENIDPKTNIKFRCHIINKILNCDVNEGEFSFSQPEYKKRNFDSISMSQPCYRNDIGEDCPKKAKLEAGLDIEDYGPFKVSDEANDVLSIFLGKSLSSEF